MQRRSESFIVIAVSVGLYVYTKVVTRYKKKNKVGHKIRPKIKWDKFGPKIEYLSLESNDREN